MPTSLHPQAKFDPIPPDLDLHNLVDRSPNFRWAQRVSRAQIRNLGPQEFEKLVHIHVIAGGQPLVIDGWEAVLPRWLFNVEWLEKSYDKKQENVRDIPAASDIPMTTGHYLRSMKQLTNQWTPHTFRDERRQRLYLKDIDCPREWRDALQKAIHPSLFYLNENVHMAGGNGPRKEDDLFPAQNTAAPAGDLMSSLPEEMRAENLMCYIGHEGTYTPAHREMCASLGQNIMVEASSDGGGEKAGSSIWFMTESKDREVVREYFLSMLGHDIEIEKHFAQINAWKKAPFDVYIVDQRPGDFILVPPLAAHQVWNRGTRTMKVAWNRTTVETLDLALHEALPKARLVCRDEQYKNKAIIHFTLQKYFRELQDMEEHEMSQLSFMGIGREIVRNSPRVRQLAGDFKRLFWLYTEIIVDEAFTYKEKDVEFLPFDSCVTCSYCRSNIFNRFLTCRNCVRTLVNGDEDTYDVCMECYAMGRSCACLSGLQWCEQWPWTELVDNYETWRAMVVAHDGFIDLQASPQPFEVARQKSGKKSVAQICQEALRRRPWKDITKQDREKTPSDSEQGDGDEKTRKKPKRKKKKGEVRRCHVCCHKDYSYRVHECSNPGCAEAYCYGVLYRAFDLMPQRVLEDEYWQCPKCLGICSCGSCRRSGNTNAYTPKNTLLGHDTRPIADDRSVEALVDFRVHNLSWLKAVGEESRSKDSRRMQRLREQANNAKARDRTHHVGTEPTVHGPKGTVESSPETAATDPNAVAGYGDQSEVVKHPPQLTPESVETHGNATLAENGTGLEHNVVTRTAVPGTGEPGASSYPDPSIFVRQRIGMGYYEQDDTPDKILFDPYQAPSPDAVRLSQSGVPEFVKRSIRAAKRKARRENEDPDFVVGKSQTKKLRLAQHTDILDNMDPALFDSQAAQPAHRKVVVASETPWREPPESTQGRPERASQKHPTMPRFDTNEPTLRHAKPRASYVELEDMELEELDEEESLPRPIPLPQSREEDDGQKFKAVETTGNTARAASTHSDRQESATLELPAVETTPLTIFKRRGRPPKQPPTAVAAVEKVATPLAHTVPFGEASTKKRRGRPRKSANLASTDLGDEGTKNRVQVEALSEKSKHDDLRPGLLRKDATQADDDLSPEGASRMRTRRSGVTTIAAATVEMEGTVGVDSASARSPALDNRRPEQINSSPQLKRRRGRPRRSDVAENDSAEKDMATNQRFMSLAERMALKGKKFKIGKRKSRSGLSGSGSMTPWDDEEASPPAWEGRSSLWDQDHEADRSRQTDNHESNRPSPPTESPIPGESGSSCEAKGGSTSAGGPTVVRLADVESDEGREWDDSSSSAVGSGDEGDIPSGRVGPAIFRGRGRFRARGGFRGRRGLRRSRAQVRRAY
ncbi:hypothetical protein CDD83_1513 [Cordyceps sp. RAO-2017]|nr:hypothetical protein CDD83_1513 [Cordyceps sp. RAO-2017]